MATRAKNKTIFVCTDCGNSEPRWGGQCPACRAWNTLVEEEKPQKGAATAGARGERNAQATPVPITSVELTGNVERVGTSMAELDRVLGGGVVPGSAVLLGGDPGIGKSTLALQLAAGVTRGTQATVLYVSGEESPAQVRLRASRLGIAEDRILVLGATEVEKIRDAIRGLRDNTPVLAIVDSVQTIYTSRIDSAPGSVAQLREASAELLALARHVGVAMLLIGHVTKEGYIAGPRVLEHMVDTVLYFEGERSTSFRILRAVKNRFGPANEIGVFEMRSAGLMEVTDPSEIFAGGRRTDAPGSVVSAILEGTRPMLVEIQALVAPSSPGSARRTTLGYDHGRVSMLAAVLERRLGLNLAQEDLYVNTAGGVRIDDTAADFAVVAALASSHLNKTVGANTLLLGEVGLTGELRGVTQARARLAEAQRLGFERVVLPEANLDDARDVDIAAAGAATLAKAWDLL